MLIKELKTLLYGHWVRMYFPNVFQFHAGIDPHVLPYLQVYRAGDYQVASLEQIIIRQNTPRNGIFDGHHSPITFLFIGSQFNHFAKSGTWNYLNAFPEKLLSRHLVKAPFIALNGKPSLAEDSTGMYSGFGFIVFFCRHGC